MDGTKWAIFGKQNWRCGINQTRSWGAQDSLIRHHERCWLI